MVGVLERSVRDSERGHVVLVTRFARQRPAGPSAEATEGGRASQLGEAAAAPIPILPGYPAGVPGNHTIDRCSP